MKGVLRLRGFGIIFLMFLLLLLFFMVKGFSLGLVKVLNKQIMSLDFSGLNSSMNFFGCYVWLLRKCKKNWEIF